MIDQTLNYTDDDGNTVSAERYYIGGDPKSTIDISNEPVRSFQTHCKSCVGTCELGCG